MPDQNLSTILFLYFSISLQSVCQRLKSTNTAKVYSFPSSSTASDQVLQILQS